MDVLSASQSDDTVAWYENDGSENFTARDCPLATRACGGFVTRNNIPPLTHDATASRTRSPWTDCGTAGEAEREVGHRSRISRPSDRGMNGQSCGI